MEEAKKIVNDSDADDMSSEDSITAGTSSELERSEQDYEGRATGSRALGLTRWVQYVFVVIAAFSFWFLDKVVTLTWQAFAEPNSTIVTAGSAVAAAVIVQRLYTNETAHRIASEIVGELAKVTWPTARETRAATIVVIITSLIAAAVVGAFDFVWSTITDLLYKYKV